VFIVIKYNNSYKGFLILKEMNPEKFIMKDESGNYAKDIAVYVSDLYLAKIFEGDPKDYEGFGNKIIILNSQKGLELLAKEAEILSRTIPEAKKRLDEMERGFNNLYDSSPQLQEYIRKHNKTNHPLIGISEDSKQKIIEKICKK
jgi:hypothetical protein